MGGGKTFPENVSVLCHPSYPFSIQIHLSPVFWTIRYLCFIAHHSFSHLSVSRVPICPRHCIFYLGVVLPLSVTFLQSQRTISVCSTELAPSAPQIGLLLGLLSGQSLLDRPSFTDKGEKAIWFHRHLPRPTVGMVSGHAATSHMG